MQFRKAIANFVCSFVEDEGTSIRRGGQRCTADEAKIENRV